MFYGSTFKNSKYVSLLLFKLFSMPDRTFVSSTNYKKRKCTSKNAFKISFIWFMTKDIHNQSLYQVSTELNILKPGEHSANGEGQGGLSVRIL